MTYRVQTSVDLQPFTLDMQHHHPDQRAYAHFVEYEKGDFVALTIGPATFYLNADQVSSLAGTASRMAESFAKQAIENAA